MQTHAPQMSDHRRQTQRRQARKARLSLRPAEKWYHTIKLQNLFQVHEVPTITSQMGYLYLRNRGFLEQLDHG